MIGFTAFDETNFRCTLKHCLFINQFLWQFPHFWSIGFLGFDDYNKAGYKLVAG
jgi:heme O synthase-like polyprenyltransferase